MGASLSEQDASAFWSLFESWGPLAVWNPLFSPCSLSNPSPPQSGQPSRSQTHQLRRLPLSRFFLQRPPSSFQTLPNQSVSFTLCSFSLRHLSHSSQSSLAVPITATRPTMSLRLVLRSLSSRASFSTLLPRGGVQPLLFATRDLATSQQLPRSTSILNISFDPSSVSVSSHQVDPDVSGDIDALVEDEDETEHSNAYGPGDKMLLEEWRVQKGSVGRKVEWVKGERIISLHTRVPSPSRTKESLLPSVQSQETLEKSTRSFSNGELTFVFPKVPSLAATLR